MAYTKISVTLESEVAAELRRNVGPRELSAFVNEAVRQHLQVARVRRLLDHMEAESGPIPDDVQSEVDAVDWPD